MSYFDELTERKQFNPYALNGGSSVAIAGQDYAIIGADTRLSVDFSIITRGQDKLFKLSDSSVLGISGCWGDALTLIRLLQIRMDMYKHEHSRTMPTPALAQMLATMLYYKRFFPYYVFNLLAGLDEEGKGCVYSYDAIGHCEKSTFRCVGSAGSSLQPLLDNQIGLNNMQNVEPAQLSRKKAMMLLKDVFTSAAERNIYTGDSVLIMTVAEDGIQCERYPLRKD